MVTLWSLQDNVSHEVLHQGLVVSFIKSGTSVNEKIETGRAIDERKITRASLKSDNIGRNWIAERFTTKSVTQAIENENIREFAVE